MHTIPRIERELVEHKTTRLNADAITVTALDPKVTQRGRATDLYRIEVWGEPLEPEVTLLKFHEGSPALPCGITDQALLAIVLDRQRAFQKGPLANRQTALVITRLEEAQLWMLHRTREREAAGVEGTQAPSGAREAEGPRRALDASQVLTDFVVALTDLGPQVFPIKAGGCEVLSKSANVLRCRRLADDFEFEVSEAELLLFGAHRPAAESLMLAAGAVDAARG